MTRRVPNDAVAELERRHRRTVLMGLPVLLLLATGPIVGHHLPLGLDASLAGRDHVWALCMAALHAVMTPVHGIFHVLFTLGVGYATVDRLRAWRGQRRSLRALRASAPAPGTIFHRAATTAGLRADDVRVVVGMATPAFTAGWLRPRVFVAAELVDCLSSNEVEAVLAHEAAHLRRRDPLRLSALRFLACCLFWIPAARALADDIADEAEIRADDHAVRGRPLALASALVKLAGWHHGSRRALGIGFDDRDILNRRVRRLAGDVVPPHSRLTRRAVAVAACALALAWSAGAVVAHPLPRDADGHEEHCPHDGLATLLHLFCPGYTAHAGRSDCPHRQH